jgi:hypothetical protein
MIGMSYHRLRKTGRTTGPCQGRTTTPEFDDELVDDGPHEERATRKLIQKASTGSRWRILATLLPSALGITIPMSLPTTSSGATSPDDGGNCLRPRRAHSGPRPRIGRSSVSRSATFVARERLSLAIVEYGAAPASG